MGMSYLDMMQEWLMQQVEGDSDDIIHRQVGASPCCSGLVHICLNQHLPQRWIRCTATEHQAVSLATKIA
jgi:hypothetical protein